MGVRLCEGPTCSSEAGAILPALGLDDLRREEES